MEEQVLKTSFYGESDFHNLAAGYNNETVYVYNERPNSKLKNGFYYSTDNGNAWKQGKLDGISSAVSSFAVHPDKSSVVAMSTKMESTYLQTMVIHLNCSLNHKKQLH